jgi:hypothetical protein
MKVTFGAGRTCRSLAIRRGATGPGTRLVKPAVPEPTILRLPGVAGEPGLPPE